MDTTEGRLLAAGTKVAILVARFNQFITDKLLEGALETFLTHGGRREDAEVVHIPGAFEMPLAAKKLLSGGRYDTLVALAAVIRGETRHNEYISSAATHGLTSVALESGIPIAFGILTTENADQALARAGPGGSNKGSEAMLTAIEMVNLFKEMGKTP